MGQVGCTRVIILKYIPPMIGGGGGGGGGGPEDIGDAESGTADSIGDTVEESLELMDWTGSRTEAKTSLEDPYPESSLYMYKTTI